MENMQFNGGVQPMMQTEAPNKKGKAGLIIALVAIVAIIAVVVVLCVTLLGGGYKKVLKENVKLINEHEESDEPFAKLSDVDGIVYELYDKMNSIMEMEDTDSAYEKSIEILEDEFGDDYKVTYKIVEKEKVDKDDLEDYEDGFN